MRLVIALALIALTAAPSTAAAPPTFATAVSAIAPAIVAIMRAELSVDAGESELDEDESASVVGSGVIIDPSGVILTNASVAASASEVVTADGRRYRPRSIALDAQSDLAVLRIGDGRATFPTARFADSDAVRVGDWVLAVGAPFGLMSTVMSGVVSARIRNDDAYRFTDVLQTSASLRSGNSGGPLVNTDGEVIGVNTMGIPGASGIAFAIPSNVARPTALELLETGRVVRPWLGLVLQRLTPDLARALGTKPATGALVADLLDGSPAAQAGVRPGEVLVTVEGREVLSTGDLTRALRGRRPTDTVTLAVRGRDGAPRRVAVVLADARRDPGTSLPVYQARLLGLEVHGLTPDAGAFVSELDPRSAAATAGVRIGDIVREVNHHPVVGVADFARLVAELRPRAVVLLLLQRGRLATYAGFTITADGAAPRRRSGGMAVEP